MAFSAVTDIGSNNSKVSSATIVITTTVVAEVGRVVVVETAWNNTDTADGDTTRLSCADSAGNTYTKIKERTETEAGVADDGATCAIFYTVVTTVLASGGTITVTSDTARPAKAATAVKVTKGAGTTLAVEQTVTAQGNAIDAPAVTVTGMASREYLLTFACAQENNSTLTQDADYVAIASNGTTGGGAETNMRIFGGSRIATLTTDTNDSATASDVGAIVCILTAIYEAGAEFVPRHPAHDHGSVTIF